MSNESGTRKTPTFLFISQQSIFLEARIRFFVLFTEKRDDGYVKMIAEQMLRFADDFEAEFERAYAEMQFGSGRLFTSCVSF